MEVKYLFAGTLLVCDPELPANCTFFWAGQLTSPDNKVDIIAFRTNLPRILSQCWKKTSLL